MNNFRTFVCNFRSEVLGALIEQDVHFVISKMPLTEDGQTQCCLYGRVHDFQDLAAIEKASKGKLYNNLTRCAAPTGFQGFLFVGRDAYSVEEYLRGFSFEEQDAAERRYYQNLTGEMLSEETFVPTLAEYGSESWYRAEFGDDDWDTQLS